MWWWMFGGKVGMGPMNEVCYRGGGLIQTLVGYGMGQQVLEGFGVCV